MSRLQIVRPEATTNICTNPSVERDTVGWASSGLATFARSATWQARGAWSIHAIADTVGDKAQAPTMTPTSGFPYTATARVHVVSGTWKCTFGTGSQTGLVAGDYDILITVTPGSGSAIRLELEATALVSSAAEAYIDGVQYEQKDHATSYCDGDQDGCIWIGTAQGSTSSRSAQTRSGGTMVDVMDDATIGFLYSDIIGVGVPPLSHLTTDLGLVDGALLQRVKAQPAVIAFNATQRASSLPGLHALRRALADLVKPDLVAPLQPMRLRYSGSGTAYDIDAHYLAGLEANIPPPSGFEKLAVQFIAYDPRWKERFDVGVSLAPNATVSANRILAQIGGVWTAFGTGATSGDIFDVQIDNAGRVWAVGSFTGIGGVSANKIAYWDGAWHALGTGLTGDGYKLAIGPDGAIYVAGPFTQANSDTNGNGIAKYDPASATWTMLGTGVAGGSATVWDLGFIGDVLYIVGQFTTVDGVPALGVARWDGTSWRDVNGVNLSDGSTGCACAAISPRGELYVGGNFNTGGGFDFEDLAKWDGSAWSEVDSSFDSVVTKLLFASDGFLYVGGFFNPVPASRVARWNGAQSVALGSGVNDAVAALDQSPNGDIVVGGAFTQAGSLKLADRIARWTGSAWKPVVINLPGSATIDEIRTTKAGDLYVVGAFAGTAVAPGITTVTNPGSSEAYPVVRVTGPGTLRGLVNLTTGAEILFDALTLSSGEVVTIDLRPGKKTVRSDIRSNLVSFVLAGSELASWSLLPGANSVAILVEPVSPITRRTATFAQNASGTNIVLTKPTALANNDTLTALIVFKGGSGTSLTLPSGWTLTSRVNNGAGATDLVTAIAQKTITNAGSEPASYTFTLGAAKAYTARLIAWVGTDTTTPIAGVVTNNQNAVSTLTVPNTSSTIAGSRLEVLKAGATGTIVISTPPSWTAEYQDGTSTAPQLETNYEVLLGAGDTGVQTITTPSSEQLAVIAFVLNPAASATQPTADLYMRPRHWGAE